MTHPFPDLGLGFPHAELPNSDPVIIRTHNIHESDKPRPVQRPPEPVTSKRVKELQDTAIAAEREHIRAQGALTVVAKEAQAKAEEFHAARAKWRVALRAYHRQLVVREE